MKERKKGIARIWILAMLFGILAGCASGTGGVEEDIPVENQEALSKEHPVLGLILSSEDASENEELTAQFEVLAEELGATLLVRIPEVTSAEAKSSRALTDEFILCEADPIEYQTYYINEMVEEDADIIAILANHPEALEPMLAAARSVDIQICAIEYEVGEESRDVFVKMEDAALKVQELLKEQF